MTTDFTQSTSFILYKTFVEPIADLGKGLVNTFTETAKTLSKKNIVDLLAREGAVKYYYTQLKLYSAAIGILAIQQLNDLGNVFKTLQDVLLALMILDNSVIVMNGWSDKKVTWYKQVSNCLRWTASAIDCVKIFEKYFGCKVPSVISVINRPKDIVIVIDCIFNLTVNAVRFFWSAGGREEVLKPKAILDSVCNLGKIILIATAADYAFTLAFRVTALAISSIALVKQWAYS
jgi:hypothetical protein